MPNELSQIILPNNTTYGFKDSTARTDIGNKPGQKIASGTTTTYQGTTYTTGDGCENFNDYSTNKTTGDYSHSEGSGTKALGDYSHAENMDTVAVGNGSHAEGAATIASGTNSHAEGIATIASGVSSHAGGDSTIAASACQTAIGKYNVSDSNDTYAFIIGNGTQSTRSNAFAIDWDGKVYPNNAATGIDLSQLASEVPQTISGTISIYNLDPGWWTRVSNLSNVSDKPSDYSGGFICHVINTGLGNPNRKMIFFYPVSADYTNIFYVATQTSSGWSSWAKYENKEQTITSIYGTGTAITTGQDLNNFTTLGSYNCNTGAIASSLHNCPTTLSFRMEVKCTNGSSRYLQEIITAPSAGDLVIFRRIYTAANQGSWQPWHRFVNGESLSSIIDSGPKNLVNPSAAVGYYYQTAYPYTSAGLTFTLNADSSITVTGGNTGAAAKTFRIPITVETGKTYVLSGCPSDGSDSSYQLDIRKPSASTIEVYDRGSTATFTADTTNYDVCIRVAKSYDFGENSQTFYIMVCEYPMYAVSNAFVPYRPTYQELYDRIVALENRT